MRREEVVLHWLGGIVGVRGTVRDGGSGRNEVVVCGVLVVCVCLVCSRKCSW